MIPRIGSQGNSFKGAAKYYLTDGQGAKTDKRVAWTHTENLPTDDPQMAWRFMAFTAMNADRLKLESGVKRSGGPTRKPVWTLSLSWHPEQEPTQEHMIDSMRSALRALDLHNRQVLLVAHNDKDYQHVHAIVSLIDPQTGRSSSLSYSKEKLARWALRYEREHGKIYCNRRAEHQAKRDWEKAQRVGKLQAINAKAEAEEEKVKTAKQARKKHSIDIGKSNHPRHRYDDPEHALKAEITSLYRQADSGKAFKAVLEEAGFKLAMGRRRIVLVDREGRIVSLARQIEGVKTRDIRAKLKDLGELPPIDEREQQEGRKHGARQEKAVAAERPAEKQTEAVREPTSPAPARTKTARQPAAAPPKPRVITPAMINALQGRQHQEMADFRTQAAQRREIFSSSVDQRYAASAVELRNEITDLQKALARNRFVVWIMKLTGKLSRTAETDLAEKRLTLENVEWRQREARQAIESSIAAQEAAIRERHQQEREKLQAGVIGPANQNIQHFAAAHQDAQLGARAGGSRGYQARRAAFAKRSRMQPQPALRLRGEPSPTLSPGQPVAAGQAREKPGNPQSTTQKRAPQKTQAPAPGRFPAPSQESAVRSMQPQFRDASQAPAKDAVPIKEQAPSPAPTADAFNRASGYDKRRAAFLERQKSREQTHLPSHDSE